MRLVHISAGEQGSACHDAACQRFNLLVNVGACRTEQSANNVTLLFLCGGYPVVRYWIPIGIQEGYRAVILVYPDRHFRLDYGMAAI